MRKITFDRFQPALITYFDAMIDAAKNYSLYILRFIVNVNNAYLQLKGQQQTIDGQFDSIRQHLFRCQFFVEHVYESAKHVFISVTVQL